MYSIIFIISSKLWILRYTAIPNVRWKASFQTLYQIHGQDPLVVTDVPFVHSSKVLVLETWSPHTSNQGVFDEGLLSCHAIWHGLSLDLLFWVKPLASGVLGTMLPIESSVKSRSCAKPSVDTRSGKKIKWADEWTRGAEKIKARSWDAQMKIKILQESVNISLLVLFVILSSQLVSFHFSIFIQVSSSCVQ